MLVLAYALMLISHVADWQLQCEQHGWRGLWWERFKRAPRAAWYIEWFPRDAWHVAQVVRNWAIITGCMLMGIYWPFAIYAYPPVFVVAYAITRGLGFSLPRKLTQGY